MKIPLSNLTTIGCEIIPGHKVTKVKKTAYGYIVKLFNPYVVISHLEVRMHTDNERYKIKWQIWRNYSPKNSYTTYHDKEGNEIDLKTYQHE